MANLTNNNSNWVFIPVHKSRVIKELEKCYLIKIKENSSTILPKVFKRKKETEEMMFFSLPQDFKMNFRYSYYDAKSLNYVNDDKEFALIYVKDTETITSLKTEYKE